MSNAIAHRCGPYHYGNEAHKVTRTFETPEGPRKFTFILSSAYNAMGLIGSEYNGIVVLDDDRMQVLADRIYEQSSGYYGPSGDQVDLWREITSESCTFGFIRDLVNESGRARYTL